MYLPKQWADDPDRRAQAGVPDELVFATKPTLAARLIEDALDDGLAAAWAAGDEMYGNDPVLRAMLRRRGLGYVLAVRCDTTLSRPDYLDKTATAAQVASWLPEHVWGEYVAG